MEIMAATTNNQKELRLYAPNEQQQQQTANSITSGARSPFQREVREWQRIDPDTGALLTGRLEADRWINGPLNKYGKKSSSSLSNSSNNSTTATQATNTSSMNTHKSMATNKISLHAIVGNNSNNNNMTTTSSTPSPTSTTARPSWQQQPTLFRQNSYNNNNISNNNSNQTHLLKSRVGDINNCCSGNRSSSCSDESRSYVGKTETDHRHLQQRQSPNSSQHHHHQQQQQQLHEQQIHIKQNDRLTPTHLPHSYHRVDLESFRHYNNNDSTAATTTTTTTSTVLNNDTDDDGLRLSSRHLRRQQIPCESPLNSLQRSRSISTDDLSTEWDLQGVDSEEPAEWRRVSKLRRSFQSTSKTQQSFSSPIATRRPLDLPTNTVSVAKIRAELENGRRLNTVMRNNHVDLAALSSILNGSGDKEPKSPLTPKRSSFLTAESLKEIRGKLKKLSDESLYKEDYLNKQLNDTNPVVEHIVNDQTKIKRTYDKSPERYRVTNNGEDPNNKHTTNSLESRLKYRDTNSTDWHIRRKSYGFEKMSPPEKAMLRMDASTDSGLGRSGELQNWSPTSDNATTNNRTVVHFGESAKVTTAPIVQRRYRPQKSYEESENSPEEDLGVSKRHSIAVDESQYVRDNTRQTTQIHLNGFYEPGHYMKSVHTETSTSSDRGQQKRVEFSKTEVHFATESGRVNIVETDSKPPPTNNFRRRRSRSSSVGPLQSLVKSATTVSSSSPNTTNTSSIPSGVAMPVTLFGDDNSKKKTIASTTVAYRAPLVGSPEPKDTGINVTVTVPSHSETSYAYNESSRSSYASTSGVDTTDCDTDEMTSLRGILKNKPAKPKPYVLGENIEKPDDLWGVQLKPLQGQAKNERVYNSESPVLTMPQKSVAERIQELGSAASSQANSFSTKINVSLGSNSSTSNNWEETGPSIKAAQIRTTNVQELLMHDLKEHQKFLDEGLKSTTLIIKTMRSATEFDEAMRRLSMASIEAAVVKPTPILRSNSYQESTQSFEYEYPDHEENKNLFKSTSYSSTSSWSTVTSTRKYSQDSRKTSTDSGASFPRKDNLPRLSFLGNEQMPVSQQLQRLRLIYDAATISQDEDSADEEVKSYFKEQVDSDSGGGTQDSSSYEDDHCLEHTNSWSRLKARKTIWKIDTDNNDYERSLKKILDKTDLPKSNVMSIKLHSPQASNEQPKVVPPIAKPRTVTTIQESQPLKLHTATTVKQAPYQTSLPTKDSLKIIKEARGARQLREHELSYFGVPVSTSEDEKPSKTTKYTTNTNFRNSPKRSLPLRKLSEESSLLSQESGQREQWQLENDKPDLLKHNPIELKPAERTSLKKKAELDEEEEHLYENIANEITPVFKVKAGSPSEQYDRKMDLKRDAMILSEMNKNADQTLRELTDEAALKDRRRRSLQRRNSKPLETIDEKSIAERINDTCIAVKISRGTYSSEAKKTSRHSTPSPSALKSHSRERTSSQSSVECCPRARSRSLSSEKEYDSSKSKPARTSQMVKHKPQKHSQSRSSSLDSQRSALSAQYSSGEEHQPAIRSTGSFRREDRSRTKTKRITSLTTTTTGTRDKPKDEKSSRQSSHHHGDSSKRLSSTTHSTSHRERAECKHDNDTTTQQQHKHSSSSGGLQRSTATSSSGRRHKDDLRDSQRIKRSSTTASGRSTTERHEKHDQQSSRKHTTRSIREDERNSLQRSSSHRLERGDNEKEKSSRSSKGHSSRSTHHQQHHERSTNPDKTNSSNTKDSKTKTTTNENTTSSKNAQHHHDHHQTSHHRSKERQHHHKSKRDDEQTEHVHGLKSAIIKTTTKLRDKSRSRKEKK
ncbi:uncharacterized protein ACRADG_003915 isoform 3-T4 [Cochliomyia hominivorax]